LRILLLTQWFDPEPTFKGLAFARALAARGHSVEALTGFPNYPGGRVYNGYKVRVRERETIDGIRITRVPLYPSHDGSSVRRIANYASFAACATLLGPFSVSKPDVVYVYHPPGTIGLPAWVIGALRRCPFVYDIQDLWPDSVAASGMMSSRLLNRVLDRWCRMVYGAAAHIVVLSPGFKRVLAGRGVPEDRVSVIYNWCDETALQSAREQRDTGDTPGGDRFRVVFAGTMGKVQALGAVLEAAARIQSLRRQVDFVFVGSGVGVNSLKESAAALGLHNVTFLPRRPFCEIGGVLRSADALLVHLKDDPLFEITIPSKTQAYMSMAKPVVMGVRGDAADLVAAARCGVVCEPENPESITEAVLRLQSMSPEARSRMGQNGRRFYDDHLSLQAGVARFEQVFQGVTAA
jgi:glycosyltransferase involved in cell wall biosynthesis